MSVKLCCLSSLITIFCARTSLMPSCATSCLSAFSASGSVCFGRCDRRRLRATRYAARPFSPLPSPPVSSRPLPSPSRPLPPAPVNTNTNTHPWRHCAGLRKPKVDFTFRSKQTQTMVEAKRVCVTLHMQTQHIHNAPLPLQTFRRIELGTVEPAIENTYRRMRFQNQLQFEHLPAHALPIKE